MDTENVKLVHECLLKKYDGSKTKKQKNEESRKKYRALEKEGTPAYRLLGMNYLTNLIIHLKPIQHHLEGYIRLVTSYVSI